MNTSNKQPSAADAKTKSAPKKPEDFKMPWALRGIIIGLFALGILAMVLALRPVTDTRTVKLGSQTYKLQVASTEAAKEKGLGDRNSLATGHGMEFPYTTAGQQCFWMKDMRFSIDIIWLNSASKVVKIEPNLSPSTYPKSYCADAQYVVELNAGQAAHAGLKLGQTAYGL